MSGGKYVSKCGLCPFSLGLAAGVTAALCMMLYAWVAWLWGYGASGVELSATFHYGYADTFVGGLIGGVWGLVEGFIVGFFIALFYDFFCRCCRSKCCKSDEACEHEERGQDIHR